MIKPIKITEDKDAYERVMGELRSRLKVDQPREGIHVSDAIYCLRKGWMLKRLDATPEGRTAYIEESPDEQVLVWIVGHSHEAIFGAPQVKADPLTVDGLTGSRDWTWFWDLMVGECKSTRASAKKTTEDLPHYTAQVAAYVYMEERHRREQGKRPRKNPKGRVLIFHINGDYYHQTTEGKEKGIGPQAKLRIWKQTFKFEDLEKWWQELQGRRDMLLGEEMPNLADGSSPAYPDWECGYCRVRPLIKCPGGSVWQAEQTKKKQKQSLATT